MTICLDRLSCNLVEGTLHLRKCPTIYTYKCFTSIQLSFTGEDGKEVHDGGHLFQNLSCCHLMVSRTYIRKTVGSIVLPMIYP